MCTQEQCEHRSRNFCTPCICENQLILTIGSRYICTRVQEKQENHYLCFSYTGCATSRATLLLRVVSQLSVDQYCLIWAYIKALFVLYTFDI
jgi:hypothetical protein